METIIYTRVSTDEQKKQGFSLQEQERSLRLFCERNNMDVIAHYQDDYSAKDFNRPAFKKFLIDLETKKIRPKVFLCVRIDRFSRNLHDSLEMQLRLKKAGVEVQFADRNYDTGNPEDLLMKVIDMTLAEVFNARLSVNTTKGMREAQRAGRFMGRAPVGYTNNKSLKAVEINPEIARYVIRAYELMGSGLYFAEEVRKKIRDEGYYFTKQQFLNILRNPFYCGLIEIKAWRNEPAFSLKGIHDPIISETLYNQVQWVFNSRKKAKGLNEQRRIEFPLRGLLMCPRCSRPLTGSASRSRTGKLHYYYHCQKKYNCNHRFRANMIHDKLEEYFGSFRIAPEVKKLYRLILEKKFSSMNYEKEMELKKVQIEMLDITTKMNSLNDKFIADQIDVESYSSIKKRLDNQLLDLKTRQSHLNSQESDFSIYMKKGITLVDNLKEFYRSASLDAKLKIVSSIFPQNLVFNENEYRTNPINEAFKLITKTINELQGGAKQNATVSDGVFDYAPSPGLEPGTP